MTSSWLLIPQLFIFYVKFEEFWFGPMFEVMVSGFYVLNPASSVKLIFFFYLLVTRSNVKLIKKNFMLQ